MPTREKQIYDNFPKKYGTHAYEILKEETFFHAKQRFGTLSPMQAQRLEQEFSNIKENYSEHIILFYRDLLKYLQNHFYVWFYSSQFNYSFVCYCLGVTHIDPIKWKYPLRPLRFFATNLIYIPEGSTKYVAEFLLKEYGYEHLLVRPLSAKILRSDFHLSKQPFSNMKNRIEHSSFLPNMNVFEGIPNCSLPIMPLPVEEDDFPPLPYKATRNFLEIHSFDDERVFNLIEKDGDSFINIRSFDELLYLFRHGAAFQYHWNSHLDYSACKRILKEKDCTMAQAPSNIDDFFLISAQNLYLRKYLSLYKTFSNT